MAQVQLDPDRRSRTGRCLHPREQLSALGDAVGVEGGLRQVGDEPAGHDRVVRRIGRVEQPPGGRVCVVVPALSQRAEHTAELGECDGDLAAGGEAKLLGSGGAALGRVGVASHAGDQRRGRSRLPRSRAVRRVRSRVAAPPRPRERRRPRRRGTRRRCRAERASGAVGPAVPPCARPSAAEAEQANSDVEGAEDERRRPQVPYGLRYPASAVAATACSRGRASAAWPTGSAHA